MSPRAKGRLARVLLGGLASTWRIRESIPPECAALLEGESPAVIAFWHSQMLPLWYRLRRLRPAAVVSPSGDGEILAGWLESIGYGAVVRGSSSRGGSEALAAAVEQLAVRSLLITPDGPRGPAREAKPGAIVAALRAGRPLVVAGWRCERVFRAKSWDRMAVPLPFARVDVRYDLFDLAGVGERVNEDVLRRFSAAIDSVG